MKLWKYLNRHPTKPAAATLRRQPHPSLARTFWFKCGLSCWVSWFLTTYTACSHFLCSTMCQSALLALGRMDQFSSWTHSLTTWNHMLLVTSWCILPICSVVSTPGIHMTVTFRIAWTIETLALNPLEFMGSLCYIVIIRTSIYNKCKHTYI